MAPGIRDGGLRKNEGVSNSRDISIRLDGAKDWTAAERVQAMYASVRRRLRRGLVLSLDLRDVRSLDTKLIACLVALRKRAMREGSHLRVLASEHVRAWMDACRVGRMLDA